MFWIYFLKLSLAHIVERFALRPRINALDRQPWALRIGAFSALKLLLVSVFLAQELRRQMMVTIAIYAGAGAVLDRLEEKSNQPAWASFVATQVGMVAVGALIAEWWATGGNIADISIVIASLLNSRRFLWISTVYLAVIFGGEQLTRRVAQHFSVQFPEDLRNRKPGLQDAGKYIGWLERLLIVTFVVGDYGEAVGFLLAAKALVRYPEIKEDELGLFGEYVLVGTLTSVGIALLGGLVLRLAL